MLSQQTYYFAGSIRGGRDDVEIYNTIISYLQRTGRVLTEHVGDYSLSTKGQNCYPDKFIHDRDLSWMRRSNLVIAETTRPSLGVGYELAMARTYGIPVVALHRPAVSTLSAMVAGAPGVSVIEYATLDDAFPILDQFLEKHHAA